MNKISKKPYNKLNAFSLLEIVFGILLIAIISSVVVSKFGSFMQTSKLSSIKSDIALIQSSIISKANMLSMQGLDMLVSLELSNNNNNSNQNSTNLFSAILNIPFDDGPNHAKWSKIDDKTYSVEYKNTKVEFVYDKDKLIFECSESDDICKEMK